MAAHLDSSEFQARMEAAQTQDHLDLSERLEELSKNDHKILAALEDRNGYYRRMEELLIGLSKVSFHSKIMVFISKGLRLACL